MTAIPSAPTQALPVGAPLAAQYVAALRDALPHEVRRLPVTSQRYRAALHTAARAAGWPLRPSRRELAAAAAYLRGIEAAL